MRSPCTVIAAGPPAAGGTLTAAWAVAGSASGVPGGHAGSAVVTELLPGPRARLVRVRVRTRCRRARRPRGRAVTFMSPRFGLSAAQAGTIAIPPLWRYIVAI